MSRFWIKTKQITKNFAWIFGFSFNRAADLAEIKNLMRMVRPVATNSPLCRIGPNNDGGYLIPDDLEGIEVCFSPGVGEILGFELDLASRGIKSQLIDGSIESLPTSHPLLTFRKLYLGENDNPSFVSLSDWVSSDETNGHQSILQMDIEGDEYLTLLQTPVEILNRFRIIVIEFHSLDMIFEKQGMNLAKAVFSKLLQQFMVVHIHPNNNSHVFKRKEIEIPTTMEFTFYNKSRISHWEYAKNYPHILDRVNVQNRKDIRLPKCWWGN